MDNYPDIFALCNADPAVVSLLGDSDFLRLYPAGQAPQDDAKPYAVFQVVGGNPENYLDRRPNVDRFTVQVDAYAKTATQCRAVAAAIRDAIELSCHVTGWFGDQYEQVTGLYRLTFQSDWIVARLLPPVISCAYPLNASPSEVAQVGYSPLALSGDDQTCTYTIYGAPAQNVQALAFASGATLGTSATLNLTTGQKVLQFATTIPATVGGGSGTDAYQVEHTLTTTSFSTVAQVKFQLDANGDKYVDVYLGATLVFSDTPASFPAVIDMRFDCDASTAAFAFDGVDISLSSSAFTPANALGVVAVYEKTDSPSGDSGEQIVVALRTKAADITGTQPAGYTDACGNAIGGT